MHVKSSIVLGDCVPLGRSATERANDELALPASRQQVEALSGPHGSIAPGRSIQAMEKDALRKEAYESALDQAASTIGGRN